MLYFSYNWSKNSITCAWRCCDSWVVYCSCWLLYDLVVFKNLCSVKIMVSCWIEQHISEVQSSTDSGKSTACVTVIILFSTPTSLTDISKFASLLLRVFLCPCLSSTPFSSFPLSLLTLHSLYTLFSGWPSL